MSKIGRLPVKLPAGVTFELSGKVATVKGPKGTLVKTLPREINAEVTEGEIVVTRKGNNKFAMSLHGTFRALLQNMVTGVSEGWNKKLELIGTGFRAEVQGKTLVLTVGYSHPVKIEAPEGITFKVEKLTITVEGCDRESVGQVASLVRASRPPEPYKGKGVKYVDEVIRRKAGKAAAKAGAAT